MHPKHKNSKNYLAAALLVFGATVSGCSEPAITGDEQNQTEINGQSPEDYFAQFLYVKVEPLNHRYPSTASIEALGESGLYFDLALYMRADGSYTFDYAEWTQKTSSEFVQNAALEGVLGTWSISGNELQLSGLGTATGIQYNGRDALDLEFDQDLITMGLKGDSATLVMVKSTWGPDGND